MSIVEAKEETNFDPQHLTLESTAPIPDEGLRPESSRRTMKQAEFASTAGKLLGKNGIQCIGRTIQSRGVRRETKSRLEDSHIGGTESESYGTESMMHARSAPILDADHGSIFSYMSSSSSVPHLDGVKGEAGQPLSTKSITDAIPAINLAAFGSEPPDMTNEQFVQWMEPQISTTCCYLF